jgi:acyl-CoA thioesterase
MPTPLAHLLSQRRIDGDSVFFHLTEDWQQGRTTFGGVISTLAVQAMRDVAAKSWPASVHLRSLQTSFIGPVTSDEVQVRVSVLREGKNVRQVQATVWQGGQLAAQLLGVFGTDRDSVLAPVEPEQPRAARSAEAGLQLPYMPGLAPAFLQHIESSWAEGDLPYSNGSKHHSRIYMRLRGEPADANIDTELLTVLLADVPPTPMLGQLTKQTPASSVSWELQLRPLPTEPDPRGWWRVDTDVLAFSAGYVNQVSRLWSPSGQLAALGYQVVTVYA